jgi:hypothetical protein
MFDQTRIKAERIPPKIRDSILEQELIDKSYPTEGDKRMKYLFDVYEHFIDRRGEWDNWLCHKCRTHILEQWKFMKPYLEEFKNQKNGF